MFFKILSYVSFFVVILGYPAVIDGQSGQFTRTTARTPSLEFSNTNVQLHLEKETGKDLELSCEIKGNSNGKTIQWWRNNSTREQYKNWKLKIDDSMIPTNVVNFTCIVPNTPHDDLKRTFIIQKRGSNFNTATEPLRFSNPLEKTVLEVEEGKDVKLNCSATGTLPSTKIRLTLINGKNESYDYKNTDGVLTRKNLGSTDFGNYTCVVQNGNNNSITRTFYVKIKEIRGNVLISMQDKGKVKIGGSTKLQCKFIPDEKSTLNEKDYSVTWWKTNQKYDNVGKFRSSNNMSKLKGNATLILSNIKKTDAGWYTCEVSKIRTFGFSSVYVTVIDDSGRSNTSNVIIISAVSVGAILLLCPILIYVCICRRGRKKRRHADLEMNEELIYYDKDVLVTKPTDSFDGLSGPLGLIQVEIRENEKLNRNCRNRNRIPNSKHYQYKMAPSEGWEVSRDDLIFQKKIGEGEFGEVHKALARGIVHTDILTEVAVKKLKVGHSDVDMQNLVMELEIMKVMGKHRNIVNLLGCCSQKGDLLVITEFASKGNLLLFLRTFPRSPRPGSGYARRQPDPDELIGYALQIARGMQFLAERYCVHRDLAARNILVDENYVMKIADFGLARTMDDRNYYSKKTKNVKLPYKWMAPEVFTHNKYTTESDVWSFGVVLWEIMSIGGAPYPEITSYQELFKAIISQKRMPQPPNCPLKIFHLMNHCWNYESERRPSFETIVKYLENAIGDDEEEMMSSNISNFSSSISFTNSEKDLILIMDEYS